MNAETLKDLLANATPGRRVQFHPDYCPEAKGTPFIDWDMSHDTSVILPDGTRYRGYAHHKHARDAALDALAPQLAADNIALQAEVDAYKGKWAAQKVIYEDAEKHVTELEAENAKLREALEPFAKAADGRKSKNISGSVCFGQNHLLKARSALNT